jgi:hypothetical protein
MDINGPAAPAIALVTSISRHTPAVEPWVKLVIMLPVGGRLLKFREPSLQLLSATSLTFWMWGEPLETNIRSVAADTTRPANGLTSNFRYDSRMGDMSA